jgi:hypothetical protein
MPATIPASRPRYPQPPAARIFAHDLQRTGQPHRHIDQPKPRDRKMQYSLSSTTLQLNFKYY